MIECARAMRQDLTRYKFAPAERSIIEMLIQLTFDQGRCNIRLDHQKDLALVTCLSRGETSRSLRSLIRQRLLQCDGASYSLLPDSEHWQARPMITRRDQETARAAIQRSQDLAQLELLPIDRTLSDAIAATSIENASSCRPATALNCQTATHTRFDTINIDRTAFELPPGNNLSLSPHTPLSLAKLKGKSLEFKSSEFKGLFKVGGTGGGQEKELIELYAEVCGLESLAIYGGAWRNRIRANPGLVTRILFEVREMKRRETIQEDAGAAAYDLWKRWQNSESK